MLSPSIQALALATMMAPLLASAAIFPKTSQVKMLDAKGFNKAMNTDQTSLVAFVAPWCGHCQRLAPEYVKVATGLSPMVPVYAVDCDVEENKRLCGEQGVKGFPTVKLYPRGSQLGSMTYEGERTAGALFKWTSLRIPNTIEKLPKFDDVNSWIKKTVKKDRAVLITKDSKIPILWKVLSNNFKGKIDLGVHRDHDGDSFKALCLESASSKVLIYPAGSTKFALYEGKTKMEPLSKHFESVLDGTAVLKIFEVEGQQPTATPEAQETEQAIPKDEL